MITDEIKSELFQWQDIKYRDFQSKLIPSIEPESMIGVRTPQLRKLAKQLAKREDIDEFLLALPHEYFEENQLHAFFIANLRDYENCMEQLCRFLPFVNNWATCDQMSPVIFKKHRPQLVEKIPAWLGSEHPYTMRFGIKMLMDHFLEEDFSIRYPEWISQIRSDEYYINMMIAWYFATALAKQYSSILPFLKEKRLDPWTHKKTIQKAIESNRILPEQKQYLRSLR